MLEDCLFRPASESPRYLPQVSTMLSAQRLGSRNVPPVSSHEGFKCKRAALPEAKSVRVAFHGNPAVMKGLLAIKELARLTTLRKIGSQIGRWLHLTAQPRLENVSLAPQMSSCEDFGRSRTRELAKSHGTPWPPTSVAPVPMGLHRNMEEQVTCGHAATPIADFQQVRKTGRTGRRGNMGRHTVRFEMQRTKQQEHPSGTATASLPPPPPPP